MNWNIVKALASKDFSLFFRNKFFGIVTVMGLVFYLLFYFLMPNAVDETLEIGVYSPVEAALFGAVDAEGLKITPVESDAALREAVIAGDYVAGISLSAEALDNLVAGRTPDITVYVASDVPEEIRQSVASIITEFAFGQAGDQSNVSINEEILGTDMVGIQIPPRDRLRPVLAIFIIMFETFGLANLIAEEIETGTYRALVITPMRARELFAGKALFGITLAFGQALLFFIIGGGMNHQPDIILLTLMLGALLATSIGFLIGAVARVFMQVLAWGMIIFVLLSVPAFGVMFSGGLSGWVKLLPTYYLVDTVHMVANFKAGWSDIWQNLLILGGFDIAIAALGMLGIRRKTA
jgi:ABC-2 type transport system permease protein